ncbi:aspartate 1-decarboxylase [Ensifer sp. Root558]|uniref:aspartate 1-decarboxylase n=1 Tax=Ensifer sp. Root558 TaxID=1736558 RepID=UPI0008E601F8|nr:Aspartate decarboxylase [Ensifer sp. OV372]
MRNLVAGKLHGIYVTEANLNYHGSITLDPDHCEEAGILPMEFVEIWNKNSGARISTYVILGERGSRCCISMVRPHAHASPATRSLYATPFTSTKAGLLP